MFKKTKTQKLVAFVKKQPTENLLIPILSLLVVLFVRFSVNTDHSLPHHLYYINQYFRRVKKGDYVKFFLPKEVKHYERYQNKKFIKKVAARGGDTVRFIRPILLDKSLLDANIQGVFLVVNDKEKKVEEVVVKLKTTLGTPVELNDTFIETEYEENSFIKGHITIPEGYLFVYGTDPDSYDSRYKEFGLIKEKEVVGIAIPLF
jgi:conjugal transfer pilin signal peptidase TrbI